MFLLMDALIAQWKKDGTVILNKNLLFVKRFVEMEKLLEVNNVMIETTDLKTDAMSIAKLK